MKFSSPRMLLLLALFSMGFMTGCTRQPSNNSQNPDYFGLSGQKIPQPNMDILRNQAALASKMNVNP